ncbi:hypothetical protein EXS70_04410 [Candidatus Peribacteria bacterium]|nr:hypothetical protein [Candidatus Peribacteria bacterium]
MNNVFNGRTIAKYGVDYDDLSEEQQKIYRYARAQLSSRARHLMLERKKNMNWFALGRKMHRDHSTMQREYATVMEQLGIALEAPWMEGFRDAVLQGEKPPLPEALTSICEEQIVAMRLLTVSQIQAILRSKEKFASGIAENVGVTLRAVLGTLKYYGQWPRGRVLSDDELVEAYHREEGNISEIARQYDVDRTGLLRRYETMGLYGKGRKLNGKHLNQRKAR